MKIGARKEQTENPNRESFRSRSEWLSKALYDSKWVKVEARLYSIADLVTDSSVVVVWK